MKETLKKGGGNPKAKTKELFIKTGLSLSPGTKMYPQTVFASNDDSITPKNAKSQLTTKFEILQ